MFIRKNVRNYTKEHCERPSCCYCCHQSSCQNKFVVSKPVLHLQVSIEVYSKREENRRRFECTECDADWYRVRLRFHDIEENLERDVAYGEVCEQDEHIGVEISLQNDEEHVADVEGYNCKVNVL